MSTDEVQLLNPYVLEQIFQFTDFESLKKFRLVNRLWDEGASRVLGKRSCIRIFHYHSTETIHERSQKWADDYEKQKRRYESLPNLKWTLPGSSNPPRFFVNFEAHVEWLGKDDNVEAKLVLDNYGKHLKSFKFQNTRFVQKESSSNRRPRLDLNDMKECPTTLLELMAVFNALDIVLNKCPGLESLQFVTNDECKLVAGDSNKLLTQFFEKRFNFEEFIPKSCNISTVELGSYLPEMISNVFIKILKVCPKLTKLRLVGGCRPSGLPMAITDTSFFEKLVEHPDITRQLLEFAWIDRKDEDLKNRRQFYQIIEVMLKMEFGPSLKILRLDNSLSDNLSHPEGTNFIRLLKKVSESLEMLELNGLYTQTCVFGYMDCTKKGHQTFGSGDVPSMKKLRVLKICSPNAYGLSTFTVLRSFPNLQTFWLNMEPRSELLNEGIVLGVEKGSLISKFIRKNDYVPEDFVHTNLKQLYLTDKHLQEPNVAYTIWECFPNLESLYMGIGGTQPLLGEHRPFLRIDKAVEIIYGLEHIKEFALFYTGESSSAEVCRALAHLKEFDKLEHFSLTNRTEGLKLVPGDLLKSLSELNNLRCKPTITLFGYEVVENEDKIQLDEFIRESGLHFDILPFPSERKYPRILEY